MTRARTTGLFRISTHHLRQLILASLVGANFIVFVLAGYSLHLSRQHYEQRARTTSATMAATVEQHLSSSIDRIDLALRALADEFERQLAAGGIDERATNALLSRYQERLPEVEAIRVADAQGLVILGKGLNPNERTSWADRDYFIQLRDHPEAGLQVSKPRTGRVAKKPIVGFARRYNRPDGSFAGVISAPVAVDYFTSLLAGFSLGSAGVVVLRDTDLDMIARYPELNAAGGDDSASRALQELAATGQAAATFHAPSPTDGIERTVSYRRLAKAPMIVITGVASADYLAEWQSEAYKTAAGSLCFALLSLLAGGLTLHLLGRLAHENARNRIYLQHAGDGIHILDEEGKVVQASNSFCAMLGYRGDEIVGMDVTRWDANWNDPAALEKVLAKLLREDAPRTFETRHRRKDGELIDVEVNVAAFQLDDRRFLFASARDIGDRKRQQRALQESETRLRQSEESYRLLLSNSPVGILHYDTDLIVTYANQRFEAIMQIPHGHLPGLDCKALRDQSVVPALRRAAGGEQGCYEGPYVTSYSHLNLWISMACAPVINSEGKILGGIAIVEDITERKRVEAAERRQRDGLARLNEIAALSHLPLGEQLRRALAVGTKHLGLEFGIVSQIEGDSYAILAHASPPETLQDGQTFPLGQTYCDITLRQDSAVAISEMGSSDHLGHPCYQAFRLEAYIGFPIRVGGEIFGTVNFSSPQPYARQFDAGDHEFISLLGRWIGSAIERDRSAKQLAASEVRLQAIIENEPECVKVIDAAGKLVQMNRAGLAILEVNDLAEANSAPLIDFVLPAYRQAFLDLTQRIFKGETGTLEFMVEGKRGTRRWLDTHAVPLRDADGKVTALLGVTRDVTEKKRADSGLRLAASVFTHAHEGILICDANQVILDANPTFSEITGFAHDEIVGRTPKILNSGRHDADFYRAMWQAIAEHGYWDGEIWNRRKDGSIFAERLSISCVRDETGQITHYIGAFSDISTLKEQQARLEHLAHYDPLTQLPNRALLSDRMRQALAQARRAGNMVAVGYLDLDGFKGINDEFGHDAGDALLIEVTRRLRENVRAGDTVARLGGDEFALVLVGIANVDECDRAASRILKSIAAPIHVKGKERCISGSLGLALFPGDDSDPDTLLRHADQAMYAVKQAGKNRYQFFDAHSDHRARNRREILERVRLGLEREEFRLHYQPIVDMRQGKVLGFEGLIRWQHPERGLLLPAEFLAALEGSELEPAIGRWVLAEGVRQLAQWRHQGISQYLSLNISAGHLLSPAFADELIVLLAEHPELEAHSLALEIAETAAIEDLDIAIAIFRRCQEAGVDIALDDFGAGHSSLSYLRRLPVNTLKVDQLFVQSVLGNPEDLAIVDSVISLTKAFDRKLVAEGVESAEVGMLLLNLGCSVVQGYAVARPMPAEAVPVWLADFVPDRSWSFPATNFTREDAPLFMAELDHRAWITSMEAWLAEASGHSSPPELDHLVCRFGQWYAGLGRQRYGRFAAFPAIGDIHREVHQLGKELVGLCGQGRRTEAQARSGELVVLRDRLIEQLAELQAEIVIEKM